MTAQDNARNAAEDIANYVFDHLEQPRESARTNMAEYFTGVILKHFPSPPSSAREREAFEKHARSRAWPVTRIYQNHCLGDYDDVGVQRHWVTWQARAAMGEARKGLSGDAELATELAVARAALIAAIGKDQLGGVHETIQRAIDRLVAQ